MKSPPIIYVLIDSIMILFSIAGIVFCAISGVGDWNISRFGFVFVLVFWPFVLISDVKELKRLERENGKR